MRAQSKHISRGTQSLSRRQRCQRGAPLGNSVRVREGLSGIAVGGRGVRPRDGEARDRRPATAAAPAAGHRDGDGVGGASEDEYCRYSSTDAVCESPQKKREEEKESGGAN